MADRYLILHEKAVLRHLERPSVYQTASDSLYEMDEEGFQFLEACAGEAGGMPEAAAEDREFVDFCIDENILRLSDRPEPRALRLRPAPVPELKYLELQITSRCNLACRHCYLGPARDTNLPLGSIKKILTELEWIQGLRVLISGGEPLLHPDFAEINTMLPDFGLRKVLLSNATLITGPIARDLNVDEVQVSLDGLEKGHDSLRGKGAFRRAVRGVEALKKNGIALSVATIVHAQNTGEFDALRDFLISLGVLEWLVDVPCPTGRLADNADLNLPAAEAAEFLEYGFGGSLHEGSAGLTCGANLMAITADGHGCKCGYYADRPLGRIDEGLETLWRRLEKPPISSLSCSCRHLEACRGGCRYRAELAGDPAGPDPVKCRAFDVD